MKVCTDSCILGAYAAQRAAGKPKPPKTILDIGGGTGLLSLMLAQKVKAETTAVESNSSAFVQMKENFDLSPWKKNLTAIHADIRKYNPEIKFDMIISNPPFYENNLKGNRADKNDAMHDSGLLFGELVRIIGELLQKEGQFMVLLPYARRAHILNLIEACGLQAFDILNISQTTRHQPFRSIITGRKGNGSKNEVKEKYLTIAQESGYTKEFADLLKDYYLNL